MMEERGVLDGGASCALEEESSMEKIIETVKSSVTSLRENSDVPESFHSMSVIVGKQNTALNNCTVNITNIHQGHSGGRESSSLAQSRTSSTSFLEEPLKNVEGVLKQIPRGARINSEEEMLLRVVPVTAEIHENCDVLILTVWLCWDDNKTFHNIIKGEHENGNITLDSYDTFILKRSDHTAGFQKDYINISLETNENNTWEPTEHQNNIVAVQVRNAHKAKCCFRLNNNIRNHHGEGQLYITLRIFQNAAGSQSEMKFILRKRTAELQLIQQRKDELLEILDTLSSADFNQIPRNSDGAGGSSLTCMAIAYTDCMLHLTDDIIVTLWLCWHDEEGQIKEALKEEQRIYSRVLLDTENSFAILNMDKPIVTDMLQNGHYKIMSETQIVEPGRVSHGMRAKFQFVLRRVESCSQYASKKSQQSNNVNFAEIRENPTSREIRKDEIKLRPTKQNNRLDIELTTKQEHGIPIQFKIIKELSCFLLTKKRHYPSSQHKWKEMVLNRVFQLHNYIKCNFHFDVRWGRLQIRKRHAFIFILLTVLCSFQISDFRIKKSELQNSNLKESGVKSGVCPPRVPLKSYRRKKVCRNRDEPTKSIKFLKLCNNHGISENLIRMVGTKGLWSEEPVISQATEKSDFPKEICIRNEDYQYWGMYGYYNQLYQSNQCPQQQQQYQTPYYGGVTCSGLAYQSYHQYQKPYYSGSQSQEKQWPAGPWHPRQETCDMAMGEIDVYERFTGSAYIMMAVVFYILRLLGFNHKNSLWPAWTKRADQKFKMGKRKNANEDKPPKTEEQQDFGEEYEDLDEFLKSIVNFNQLLPFKDVSSIQRTHETDDFGNEYNGLDYYQNTKIGMRPKKEESKSDLVRTARDGPKNVCVLKIHLLVSFRDSTDDTLIVRVLFSRVTLPSGKHDLLVSKMNDWTVADSSDTFYLQIPLDARKKGEDSIVKTTFEAHHTSYWTPVVRERTIAVEEIMGGEIVQQDCHLIKNQSDSQNGRVYLTIRVTQGHGTMQREAQFIVRKKVEEIKGLIKQKVNMNVGDILRSSIPSFPKKVMHDECQTCLVVPYVDRMQNVNDDIILTVWMCSIQQNTQEFEALQEEQKYFSRVQLDTENSFVFSNMHKPITAMLSVFKGPLEVRKLIKELEPLQIKVAQRAKFQFVCKNVNVTDICDVVDLRISILQEGESNEVQFMARKKVKLFLEDHHLSSQHSEESFCK